MTSILEENVCFEDDVEKLCRNGKEVLKKNSLQEVLKEYKRGQGSISHTLRKKYAETGERRILNILGKSTIHQRLHVRFTNKGKMKPVTSKSVFERIQIDLIGMRKERVAVEVRVLSVSQQTVQVVRESPIKRQEITVADSTAAMKLTIWEDLVSKLEVDKSYKILHLSTRLFQNAKSMTSTKQTTISQIPDIINCAPAIDTDVITKEGKITQAGLALSYLCDNCKSKVDFSNQKLVRCQSCKLKMTKESLHRSISGTLCFSSGYEKYKLTIFSSVLLTLATTNNPDSDDNEVVEEYLLSNSFKISFSQDNKTVLDIKLLVPDM
ncbi:uncharacterized protein LOC134259779 [Saccostrea cucullata]|uniref:uncharacterized protein LOC134259779 n=1 Tax=Saccostrea cuccullata TaxID=36930 RepID=UPI002ED5BB67